MNNSKLHERCPPPRTQKSQAICVQLIHTRSFRIRISSKRRSRDDISAQDMSPSLTLEENIEAQMTARYRHAFQKHHAVRQSLQRRLAARVSPARGLQSTISRRHVESAWHGRSRSQRQ